MTILQAQVNCSSMSCVLLKFTAEQVLVFDRIAGSRPVKLLRTELDCLEAR